MVNENLMIKTTSLSLYVHASSWERRWCVLFYDLKVVNSHSYSLNVNKSVTVIGNEPTRRENYIKVNTMPLHNVCQYFTLIRVFKYYRLKHSLHYYRLFGTQEVRHNYNTRFSSNNNLNMPQIHSSKYKCFFFEKHSERNFLKTLPSGCHRYQFFTLSY